MLNMSHFKLKWVSAKEKRKHNNIFEKIKDNDRATLLTFTVSIHFFFQEKTVSYLKKA